MVLSEKKFRNFRNEFINQCFGFSRAIKRTHGAGMRGGVPAIPVLCQIYVRFTIICILFVQTFVFKELAERSKHWRLIHLK